MTKSKVQTLTWAPRSQLFPSLHQSQRSRQNPVSRVPLKPLGDQTIRGPCQATLQNYSSEIPFTLMARIQDFPFSVGPQPSPVLSPWGAVLSSQTTCNPPGRGPPWRHPSPSQAPTR